MTSPADAYGATVRAAVARVATRMRLAAALRAGVYAAVAWVLGAAILIAAFRLGGLTGRGLGLGLLLSGIAALAYVAARAQRVADLAAAQLADRQLGLADRLASARVFLDDPAPSALMQAAIADASTAAAALDARRVLTLQLPRIAWALPGAFVFLGLATLLHPQVRTQSRPPAPPKPRLVVEEDALKAELEAVRKLAAEERGKDTKLAEVAKELEALLAAIDRQELSRAEAFAKLAALEAKYAPSTGRPTRASEQLAPMMKPLRENAQTKKLAEALAKDDLESARKELDRLAAEAEKHAQNGDNAEAELARALERAGRALDEAQRKLDAEREQKIEALKEEQRRLEREKRERPDDEELERRLQRNKRELERLEREKQEAKEQRRQLERLSRELQKAAEELRKQMSPEAMRRAAEQLSQMEDEIRKLGDGARAQMQIVQLKEVLRRAGQVQSGNGRGQKGQQGQQGQQGQKGQGGGGRERRLAEFDQRAGGEPNALLLGGDGNPNSQSVMLPLPGGPGSQPGGPGDQQGQGGTGDPDKPGGGIGTGHDPDLLGDRTRLDARHRQIRAQGMAGKGPSRSQTILGASERGFSSREYGQAYKDYSAIVEEVMSQEGIPPGYRYYVKRYFQLIRPRE